MANIQKPVVILVITRPVLPTVVTENTFKDPFSSKLYVYVYIALSKLLICPRILRTKLNWRYNCICKDNCQGADTNAWV